MNSSTTNHCKSAETEVSDTTNVHESSCKQPSDGSLDNLNGKYDIALMRKKVSECHIESESTSV